MLPSVAVSATRSPHPLMRRAPIRSPPAKPRTASREVAKPDAQRVHLRVVQQDSGGELLIGKGNGWWRTYVTSVSRSVTVMLICSSRLRWRLQALSPYPPVTSRKHL